ncbi:Crp/Fnr family transcriptional regulator [Bengtsoniella intestinalis]|uniref:Crp/Fnr family transcriptional regulator n=1 Tax=Bengtsoniella intestinalis TaxID=3073143 RepID=UPI00391FB963
MVSQSEFRHSPLFADVSYEEYQRMLICFQAKTNSFRSESIICDFSEGGCEQVGIIERGEASLIRIDEDGQETVLEELGAGGVFGRTLAFGATGLDSVQVVCRSNCDVLFIDYSHILKRCENACFHHSMVVQNMLQLMADKAQHLSQRVDVLSRRSIREKLLCYLRHLAVQQGSETVHLPFSLSTLADYIATDRSAMMRELKRLRSENYIQSSGRDIRICQ